MSGRVILMGSGELAPGLVATHRSGLEAAGTNRVAVLDTPYGFQENADLLTDRIADFFATSLVAEVDVASLRREDAGPVAQERFLATLRSARYIFSGPGSPSYALRVWNGLDTAEILADVVRNGGTLTFASAASLTLGRTTLPVYEIYKVGEQPRWLAGMDVLGSLDFPCTVVPHWNNAEGGNHDTSRCYVGERRFGKLAADLDVGVLGVDEHTAATIDFAEGRLSVTGVGNVTLRGAEDLVVASGYSLPIEDACAVLGKPPAAGSSAPTVTTSLPDLEAAIVQRNPDAVLAALLDGEAASLDETEARGAFRTMLVRLVDEAASGLSDPRQRIAGFVDLLLELRDNARSAGDYAAADLIRDGLVAEGIEVQDGPDGTVWEIRPD